MTKHQLPATNTQHSNTNNKLTPLEIGIMRAVAYADIFDYPLTVEEIHRYLVEVSAALAAVQTALDDTRLIPHHLDYQQGYYTLPGRTAIIDTRRNRASVNTQLWPAARRYGRLLARLPFVRMVAVTGALASNNAKPGDDIDYMIITEPGRLWLCRALVILFVHLAARRGDTICPNYFLSEHVLALSEHEIFTAYELAKMVPIAGDEVFTRMLALNTWMAGFLPNANSPAYPFDIVPTSGYPLKALLELLLRTPPGSWLERWEMARKIKKFAGYHTNQPPKTNPNGAEATFSADRCKGHFDGHGRRTLDAYITRLKTLDDHPQ